MKFVADFHIHSRFSRATARNLNLPTLDYWAARKGLAVIGTGDVVHPQWLAEIQEQLVEAEEGLYKLRSGQALDKGGGTRFILTTEISSIYKKGGRVRKVHSLILLPGVTSAQKLADRLERIGNIHSDGRPILGLDVKNLLDICLDISPDIFFIPAHIWTPWFSLLGSKSGFDSVEECFEDLTRHIHALETGLSSDPPMNWLLSALDRFTLVSNSDAHSPAKLAREANLFDTELSYPAMTRAMKGRGGFGGTIEFFPEEGKYHLDGHRKCAQRLNPEETRSLGGVCPVCGRPVTVGVMNRVLELADRTDGAKPKNSLPFVNLIPLAEVLSETIGVGPQSKRVQQKYNDLLMELGPELYILREAPLEDIGRAGGELLSVGIERMRQGQVQTQAGYDGEFGRISLFGPGERERLAGQGELFRMAPTRRKEKPKPKSGPKKKKAPASAAARGAKSQTPLLVPNDPLVDDLNPAQRKAVTHGPGPLRIVAGPGTGKTLVLTRRAAWLVREGLARPEEVLGLTFTRQAAGEMAARLVGCLPFRPRVRNIRVLTFHALGLDLLTKHFGREIKVLSEEERLAGAKKAAKGSPFRAPTLLGLISLAKQNLEGPGAAADAELSAAFGRYEANLAALDAVDFDDLVLRPVDLLENNPDLAEDCRRACQCLLIDEYQDINLAQYRLIRLLTDVRKPNLTVIGDPDQAIYGFRGADAAYFQRFIEDFPKAKTVGLTQNYRSTDTILSASAQVIAHNPGDERPGLVAKRQGPAKVTTAVLPTPRAEAEFVAARIERLLGGTSHYALNSGRADSAGDSNLSLGDVAVLYRLHTQAEPLAQALAQASLPVQQARTEPLHETDHLDFSAEKINLLTMHAAKGLEFEAVFIVGLEQGLLPYQPPGKPPAQIEEERRLFYVALTRAKRFLYLTRSKNRTLFGRKNKPLPSPFLDEIEKRLKAVDKLPDRSHKARQLRLF